MQTESVHTNDFCKKLKSKILKKQCVLKSKNFVRDIKKINGMKLL